MIKEHSRTKINSQLKEGAIWTTVNRMSVVLMQFFAMIILARLLSPDDFAIMGVVLFFVAISQVILDSGMGGSLVRKKDVTDIDYSTFFIFNMGVSILMYLVLLFFAERIASFYNMPELSSIINVIGLSIVASAFGKVQTIILTRDLRFRELSIISIVSSVVSLIIAVALALKEFGVWALVIQNLVQNVLIVTLQFIYNRYLPKIMFSKESFKEQWAFGVHLLLSQTLYTVYQNVFSLVFPKISTLNFSGLFAQANKIQQIPMTISSSVVQTVAFPILAKIDDAEVFKVVNRNFARKVYLVIFAILSVMVIFSKQLILVVLGDKWVPAASILSILSIGGVGILVMFIIRNTFKSMGKTNMIFRLEIIKILCGIVLLACAIMFGDYAILWSMVIASCVATIISIYILSKESNISQKEQYYDIFYSLKDILFPVIFILPLMVFCVINTYLVIFCILPLYLTLIILSGMITGNEDITLVVEKLKKKFFS